MYVTGENNVINNKSFNVFYWNWKYMIYMLLYGYFHIAPYINLRHPY